MAQERHILPTEGVYQHALGAFIFGAYEWTSHANLTKTFLERLSENLAFMLAM